MLAALCSIGKAHRALSNVYDIFVQSTHGDNDQRFSLQQMGVCFSCELARLATSDPSCMTLASHHIQKIFCYLVTALVDPDTLAMFPTSNLQLLSTLDGHNSRSKGNDSLSKAQIHSVKDDPDQEAYKIKRMSGDYFDTAGPSYTSKNIWSFCENVGLVLMKLDTWPLMKSIGNDMLKICHELRTEKDLLDLLPLISVERECLKRLLFFQALFVSLKQDKDGCLDAILGTDGGLFCGLSTSLIENLYYLSGIELEIEQQINIGCNDPVTRYQRAKALVFQRAYTELCGALMTLMLQENVTWKGTDTFNFVRSNMIASTFRGNLDLRRSIEASAVNFSLCLRKKSAKGNLNRMSEDLLTSFFRRTNSLLVYAASCADNYRAVLFNAMLHGLPSMDTAMIDSFMKAVSYRLILTSDAVGVHTAASSDGLQRAVDDRLLYAEVLSDDAIEKEAILSLRSWVMDNFFVILLNSRSTATSLRSITLKLLMIMIKTFSSKEMALREKIYDPSGNLTSIETCAKLFHSIKECLCISIRSGVADSVFIAALFSCARQFLALPMADETSMDEFTDVKTVTLLSLAHSSSSRKSEAGHGSSHLAYIYEISMWLNICGKLLQNQASLATLRGYLVRINNKNGDAGDHSLEDAESRNHEMQQLCSSFNTLKRLERDLSLVKINSSQRSNPYAKKTLSIGSDDRNPVVTDESLTTIKEFSNCLADTIAQM